MFNLNKDRGKHVHFIGIGGISMSGLAEILLDYGYAVSGSDRSPSPLTDRLQRMGASVYYGQKSSNITNPDLVVYTAAISDDNPELLRASELNIPVMDRAEFLGDIMKDFSKSIAVSGTHGKTTTTSMISMVLLNANLDPTIMVGGELDAIGGNVRPGKGDYLVAEACEYKGSFLKFHPFIGIILNIDADHLDYYKDINEIQDTFLKFAGHIPDNGLCIGCAEDLKVLQVMNSLTCRKLTYGIRTGDFTAGNITYNSMGCASFSAIHEGRQLGEFTLSVPGEHNVLNALAAIACGSFLGISSESMQASLKSFTGTHRRFEIKGNLNGITIIDDYAHHPVEIAATLKAAKNYPHRKIFCIFQPHTYTRTISLFNEFAGAFGNADKLILIDIYAARENDPGVISSEMLCDAVRKNNTDAVYIDSFDKAVEYISNNLESGDILITMGAGDVYKIGEDFLSKGIK